MSKFRGAGKWKADGPAPRNTGPSIRGKISAPIIQDDDEFPIRLPGTGIATPLGKDSMERQRLQLRSSAGSTHVLQSDGALGAAVDIPKPSPSPPQPSLDQALPRTSQPTPLRISTASTPSGTNDGKAHRKKSTLGSVFRKIFGKKRKDSLSSITATKFPGGSRAGQHRSDPTALNRSPKDNSPTQKRSASLPINEFNRALRSHSTVLEDFPLQEMSKQDSIQVDGRARPRRATTPSRLWTANRTPGYLDWTGLSPRPASIQVRDSKFVTNEEADGAVGIAVTSGSHPNRRSRSLGELRGIVPQNIIVRRRSDEIKYWRESYDPGLLSPMSSNRAEAEEPIQLDPPEMPHNGLPREQPQPFNFGPMGEMAGMKITQAASLETRVQRLEDRIHQMEKAVSQIHRGTSREPLVFQSPPKRNSRRDRSISMDRPRTDTSEITLPKQPRLRELQPDLERYGGQKRSSSYGSSRPSTTSAQNLYDSSFDNFSLPNLLTSDEQTPVNTNQVTARPLSMSTTIRGLSPTMSKDAPLTGEHWTALISMLLAEQAARQDLEALVHNLQQQLHDMRSSDGAFYPSPESDRLADPIKNGVGGQYSSFEADDSSDDEGRCAQEDFQTPNEESGPLSDGIFGGVNGVDAKNAPRTLSLSKLTLGKGVQQSVHF